MNVNITFDAACHPADISPFPFPFPHSSPAPLCLSSIVLLDKERCGALATSLLQSGPIGSAPDPIGCSNPPPPHFPNSITRCMYSLFDNLRCPTGVIVPYTSSRPERGTRPAKRGLRCPNVSLPGPIALFKDIPEMTCRFITKIWQKIKWLRNTVLTLVSDSFAISWPLC